jgi:DNA modification methylase
MDPFFKDELIQIYQGDCLSILPKIDSESIDACITSPPYYGLRDYGVNGQIGLEETPAEYVKKLVAAFQEIKRVLKNSGTLWLNLGDSYVANGSGQVPQTKSHPGSGYAGTNRNGKTGLKQKNLIGIPWKVAFALQAEGWILRQDIIWAKPNVMPESVTDRCTKSHEYIFLLSKSKKYYYDAEAIQEKMAESTIPRMNYRRMGNNNKSLKKEYSVRSIEYSESEKFGFRNKRSVWTVPTCPFRESHFATFPEGLITPCILAGCPPGGTTIDPFSGAGTVAHVSKKLGRKSIGIELNPDYIKMSDKRTSQGVLIL